MIRPAEPHPTPFQTNSREVEARILPRRATASPKFQTNSREVEATWPTWATITSRGFQTNSREVEAGLQRGAGREYGRFQTNSREVEAFIAPSTSPITESFRRTLVRLKRSSPSHR